MADPMTRTWRPSASIDALHDCARAYATARAFFAERGVLEVMAPCLGARTVTDPHVHAVSAEVRTAPGAEPTRCFLQTSPEYAMKRLLAAGSGCIYHLGPAFRDHEVGPRHATEFTLLEWYRCGFDHHRLMDEVEALVQRLAPVTRVERLTYREAMRAHAAVDPFDSTVAELRSRCALADMSPASAATLGRDECLDLLLDQLVAPALGAGLVFVYEFPGSMAGLARVRDGTPAVAERFEAFLDGVEIANGYHELTDAAEQARRFDADRDARRALGLADVAPDERLLAALESGLPQCAGVALGLDRLLMVSRGASTIDEIRGFGRECA